MKSVLIISLILSTYNSQAEEIVNGMSTNAVIRLMGSPLSKIEQETLRREIWRYPEKIVVFRDGKVIEAGKKQRLLISDNTQTAKVPEKLRLLPALQDPPKFDGTVTDFFRSIEKESGPEGPSSIIPGPSGAFPSGVNPGANSGNMGSIPPIDIAG